MAHWKNALYSVTLLSLSTCWALAGPLDDAKAARDRGDAVTAFRLFKPLADSGLAEAQWQLGEMYFSGQGIGRDDAEATKWLRRSAEQGFGPAQRDLGLMYYLGRGAAKNSVQAEQWFKRAAGGGDVESAAMLGAMYDLGDGVPKNDTEGAKWDLVAARYGNSSAQYRLGQHYRDGNSIPQDKLRAYAWFDLAVAGIGEDAVRERDKLALAMTADQIVRAKQLVRSWTRGKDLAL